MHRHELGKADRGNTCPELTAHAAAEDLSPGGADNNNIINVNINININSSSSSSSSSNSNNTKQTVN